MRVSGGDVTRKIRGFLIIGFQQPDSFPFEFPAKPFLFWQWTPPLAFSAVPGLRAIRAGSQLM
ncbi:MAG: hypothetical protein Q8L63_04325, partial [Alphaproteobacteria bacterium]|nr:hypothetical protein [Alphaproteobacteria bacterium]